MGGEQPMGTQGTASVASRYALEIKADQWNQRDSWRNALEPPLEQSYPMYRRGGVCIWALSKSFNRSVVRATRGQIAASDRAGQ